MSKLTKKYKRLYHIFSVISMLIMFLPLFIFICKGYAEAESVTRKAGLTCCISLALILTFLNIILKYSIRSTIWILLLGVYACLDNILVLILLIAISTIIDEFLLTPLKKSFKSKYTINKEIDKRL